MILVFIYVMKKSKIVGHFRHAKFLAVQSSACRARGSDSVSISMRAHALPLAASWPPAGCLPASQPFHLSLSSVHDRFCKQRRSFLIFSMHCGILGGSDLKIYDFSMGRMNSTVLDLARAKLRVMALKKLVLA